jgi:hypothetical protein
MFHGGPEIPADADPIISRRKRRQIDAKRDQGSCRPQRSELEEIPLGDQPPLFVEEMHEERIILR